MACLENCQALINEAELDFDAYDLVEESLRSYHGFRKRGGFQPLGGDVLYNLLREQFRQLTGSATDIPRL